MYQRLQPHVTGAVTACTRCELAARTHGFCGADLRALTAEAALRALRGAYPQANLS